MIEAWGRWTLETSVIAGLIGILVLVGVRLLRPAPKPRSVLLALGMIPFVLPPLVYLALSHLSLPWALGGPLESANLGAVGSGGGTFLGILALAQWAGLAVGSAILGRSALQIRRILRDGERVESGPVWETARLVATGMNAPVPDICITAGWTTAAPGIVKGTILLPRRSVEGLDPAGLRMILAHETAHLARRDPLAAALRHLWVALWWFHPVVWILARAHRAASEDACDDAVVAGDDGDPEAYCRTLVAWAARIRKARHGTGPEAPTPLATPLGSHPLERRIRRMLEKARSRDGSASEGSEEGWGPPGRPRGEGSPGSRVRHAVGGTFLAMALLMLPARTVSWSAGADEVDEVEGVARTEEVVIQRTRVVVR